MTLKWFNLKNVSSKKRDINRRWSWKKNRCTIFMHKIFYLKMHPFFSSTNKQYKSNFRIYTSQMSETFHPFIIFLAVTHLKNQNWKNAPWGGAKVFRCNLQKCVCILYATAPCHLFSLDNAFLCTYEARKRII